MLCNLLSQYVDYAWVALRCETWINMTEKNRENEKRSENDAVQLLVIVISNLVRPCPPTFHLHKQLPTTCKRNSTSSKIYEMTHFTLGREKKRDREKSGKLKFHRSENLWKKSETRLVFMLIWGPLGTLLLPHHCHNIKKNIFCRVLKSSECVSDIKKCRKEFSGHIFDYAAVLPPLWISHFVLRATNETIPEIQLKNSWR